MDCLTVHPCIVPFIRHLLRSISWQLHRQTTDTTRLLYSLSMQSISFIHWHRYSQCVTRLFCRYHLVIVQSMRSPFHSFVHTGCMLLLFFQINPDCPSTNCSIRETFIHECFKWSKNLTYSNVLSMQFYNFLPCDFSCPNKTQPVECSAGSYAATGSFKCHLCPKGAFCPTKGLSTFHLCVNGTYSNIEGLSDCKICDAGFRCPRVGMEAPEECPNGTYSYSVGARYCVLCPEGHRWGFGY